MSISGRTEWMIDGRHQRLSTLFPLGCLNSRTSLIFHHSAHLCALYQAEESRRLIQSRGWLLRYAQQSSDHVLSILQNKPDAKWPLSWQIIHMAPLISIELANDLVIQTRFDKALQERLNCLHHFNLYLQSYVTLSITYRSTLVHSA